MKNLNITNKVLMVLLLLVSGSGVANAQLSGTYTIGGSSPDYSTLSVAISDLNSQGVNGPVVFNIRDGVHSGSSWRGAIGNIANASSTNTITFKSQSGDRGNCVLKPTGSSSKNYVFYLNGAKYVTIKDLTLYNTHSSYGCDIRISGAAKNNTIENCVLTGHTGNSTNTNKSRIYGTSLASSSNITVKKCLIQRGSAGAYLYGNNTSSTVNGYVFEDNVFDQNYYYWVKGYYMGNVTFEGNEFKRSGSASSYFYGLYLRYTANSMIIKDNKFNNTCKAYYNYCGYWYRSNYYSKNKTNGPKITGNVVNMTTGSSTRYNRAIYNYYTYYGYMADNTFNIKSTYSSGYMYAYYLMYYNSYSRAENNTYNLEKSGGYLYSGMYGGSKDTFVNNTINVKGNATEYNYLSGQCHDYYIMDNDINMESYSRTIYGAYIYYYEGIFANNNIDCQSSYGTIYGMYCYRQNSSKIFNNIVTTKTKSSSYTLRAYYNYSPKVFNNTFHSNSTGSTNYGVYVYHSSSSYDMTLRNNIFSRSSTKGYAVYFYRSNYVNSDYNLYSVPGGNIFYRSSPYYKTNSLSNWRKKTGDGKNSLIYEAPFVNASNRDFHIDASSPAAWAVNGRGEHDTTAAKDYANVARATDPVDGVPDMGAYEVTPTSTPPYADASPSSPQANKTQVFTFGQDTVMSIDWGSSVPSSYQVRQYTGIQAGPMPAGVGRMYFYVAPTTSDWTHKHNPKVYYKDPWIGDVSSEPNAVIARSSNGGTWEGYNYTNCQKDGKRNFLYPTDDFDSLGAYTGVENGRIGIRCVTNPSGIIISDIKASEATVDWDPVFNPIGYQLLFLKTLKVPTDADWAGSSFASSNNHTAFGLDEDTKYYLYIRSICGVKDTSGYTIDSFITLITCHTPDIQISSLNNNRAVASWQNVKTATKYEYVINSSAAAPSFGTDLTKTSVLASYLDPNTQYYVHVRAHCNSIYNMSEWSTQPFKTWGLGVNNVSETEQGISSYPNPATDVLTVTISGKLSGKGMITITDLAGRVVSTRSINANTVSININDLPAGMYILKYSDDDRNEQVRFSKQ